MTEYNVKDVTKTPKGYLMTCEVGNETSSKMLPILKGFEPKAGDTLVEERDKNGKMELYVNRGDRALFSISANKNYVKFKVYNENGVDVYKSGSLQPEAVRKANIFFNKCSKALDKEVLKGIKTRYVVAATAFVGALASMGTDPLYVAQANLSANEIESTKTIPFLVCGATAVASITKGIGHKIMDKLSTVATNKHIKKNGIKVYGKDGKVVNVVAGLDDKGNPTGDFYNKNLINKVRGGRHD